MAVSYQETEVLLARGLLNLSKSSKALLMDLAKLLRDYEDAASWKSKYTVRIKTKQQTAVPGNPAAAAILMDLEKNIQRIIWRRRNSLHHLKKDLAILVASAENHLVGFERSIND